ncbi:hypothetical protein BGZ83_000012 [Gryganskiella cystojenkinii]|nr:hypothetical protein BGZ83_000012 [Gryganskiella cystojenkinii]
MNSAKLIFLVGLCVVSLLAVSRMFTPQQDNGSLPDLSGNNDNDNSNNNKDRDGSSQRDKNDELERSRIVKDYLETRKSAFKFEDFTDEGLIQSGNEHLLPTSAILLGWKRMEDLKLIVAYLVRYPYIKQIIVWNNNRDIHLSKQEFLDTINDHLESSIRNEGLGSNSHRDSMLHLPQLDVFNGVENMHDMAKYMSCSLAKYDYCYFQDDDWLNTHMDSLYTNFLTSPELIHTNTLPLIQMEHRQWTFTNENYNMHAGFSWLGTGSFIPKSKAKRLIQQRGNTTLAKDRYKVIDMYFSIWSNQYPYQLVNYLTPLDQKSAWSTEEVEQHWSTVFRNMLDAADRLYSALLSNFEVTNMDFFVREEEKPLVKDRHARSPCSNDRCLFMTSIDPFSDPSEVVFEGNLKTMNEQVEKFSLLDYPTQDFWKKFAYVHAVDNDPLTCWNSFKVPRAGDSFGLRFVKPIALKHWTIMSSKSLTVLEGQITVLASDHRGVQWTICPHTTRYPFAHTMVLDINCPLTTTTLPGGMIQMVKVQLETDLEKSLEICGFGHATRVNQIITELLKSGTGKFKGGKDEGGEGKDFQWDAVLEASQATPIHETNPPSNGTKVDRNRTKDTHDLGRPLHHAVHIVSDAPQFIFQDVIALGATYRNAKVDAGVVQPLAYSVDRQKTIEGVKSFLARRDEMVRLEVEWLTEVQADCVLADAPFLPCAAAYAKGIPACLITNFTFDEVYRFLREGDPMDRDVIACADAALEDYKKASLLLRLPGSIDIPSFEEEILALETKAQGLDLSNGTSEKNNGHASNASLQEGNSGLKDELSVFTPTRSLSPNPESKRLAGHILPRRALDVPMVVRKAINTREDVLRALGVEDEIIKTHKMVLVSFGGQRLKQGWGNPLPEGWIGVICGLPVSHELPEGFYRSPHGVYVPDLTEAADIVIGKLGYGTCSECIAHDTPLIYVSRPQFVEEHGLIMMMVRHGLPVEMTAEEFETGLWRRSILSADKLAQEEREGRRLFHLQKKNTTPFSPTTTTPTMTMQLPSSSDIVSNKENHSHVSSRKAHESQGERLLPLRIEVDQSPLPRVLARNSSGKKSPKCKSLAESVNMAEMARGGPISPVDEEDSPSKISSRTNGRSRSMSLSSTSATLATYMKLKERRNRELERELSLSEELERSSVIMLDEPFSPIVCSPLSATAPTGSQNLLSINTSMPPVSTSKAAGRDAEGIDSSIETAVEQDTTTPWFERRIPHHGGEVCAKILEEFMLEWDEAIRRRSKCL